MRVGGILRTSLVNGPGSRYVVFTSGCKHNCKGCHNKPLQDYTYGKDMTVSELSEDIARHYYANLIQGVTISGGEPFDQPEELEDLIYDLIHCGIRDIWIYTGYTYEEARQLSEYAINNASVLVDGKFDMALMDENIKFRGSINQRVIDLQASLVHNEIIVINEDNLKSM